MSNDTNHARNTGRKINEHFPDTNVVSIDSVSSHVEWRVVDGIKHKSIQDLLNQAAMSDKLTIFIGCFILARSVTMRSSRDCPRQTFMQVSITTIPESRDQAFHQQVMRTAGVYSPEYGQQLCIMDKSTFKGMNAAFGNTQKATRAVMNKSPGETHREAAKRPLYERANRGEFGKKGVSGVKCGDRKSLNNNGFSTRQKAKQFAIKNGKEPVDVADQGEFDIPSPVDQSTAVQGTDGHRLIRAVARHKFRDSVIHNATTQTQAAALIDINSDNPHYRVCDMIVANPHNRHPTRTIKYIKWKREYRDKSVFHTDMFAGKAAIYPDTRGAWRVWYQDQVSEYVRYIDS